MTSNLYPVVCADETEAADVAFDGVRRRPVVAINDDGNLVVCCRRTAARNAWQVKGTLHQRTRGAKLVVEEGKLVKAQGRRTTDQGNHVVVSIEKVEQVKGFVESALGDLLG